MQYDAIYHHHIDGKFKSQSRSSSVFLNSSFVPIIINKEKSFKRILNSYYLAYHND